MAGHRVTGNQGHVLPPAELEELAGGLARARLAELNDQVRKLTDDEQLRVDELAAFVRRFEADWHPFGLVAIVRVALEGEAEGRLAWLEAPPT